MIVKVFIVSLVTLLIFLVTGEIGLRKFTFYGVEYYTSINAPGFKIMKDSSLPYINTYAEDLLRDAVFKLNQNHNRHKQMYKIFVLGDSIITGGELKPGEPKFADILKEELGRDNPNIDFHTLVFAEGGYSTNEEVKGYEKYGEMIKPDLVILAYCHNDTAESFKKIRKISGHNYLAFYKTDIPYLDKIPLNRFLTERFLIFRMLNEIAIKISKKCNIMPDVEYCLLADQKIYKGFNNLYLLTKETKTPVVIVVFPYLEDPLDISRVRMSGLIKKWCTEFNFLYIDLLEAYKRYDYKKLRCSPNDAVHPNAVGHRVAAELIAKELELSIFKRASDFIGN